MHLDVIDLRDFYASRLGLITRRFIRRKVRLLWPDLNGLRVLGLGYATPYLRPFHGEAERIIALMPAAQGVTHWPVEGPNAVALSDEHELPLPDASFDRILLAHILENTESIRPLLRQVWRVLAPAGRIIVVAPNRHSLWAQIETTPFGQGHPYTSLQLSRLLRDSLFTPETISHALYMPPFSSRMLTGSGVAWESSGARLWPSWSGVLITEATKQIYAVPPAAGLRRVPARVRILEPARPRALPGGRG
ncbi:MAG: methyltransferase domain-containing protein [Alphaproteobacteria bacterium]|nr:methyltransferase domain-containing protein [Alphaproteobacteria bacterium]